MIILQTFLGSTECIASTTQNQAGFARSLKSVLMFDEMRHLNMSPVSKKAWETVLQ